MSKKVSIGGRPTATRPVSGDDWVASRNDPLAEAGTPIAEAVETKMKRLTIDIPEDLHRAVKRQCADDGAKIADVVRGLLRDWVEHRKS